MTDNRDTIKDIVKSLMNFTFVYDIEEGLSKLEQKEVPRGELEKLGFKKIEEKFRKGIYKLKFSDEIVIDAHSIGKFCKINNIEESDIFKNPNQKYVHFESTEDLTNKQLKRHIRNQLANSTELDIDALQKALVVEESENKQVEGYIDDIGIKTSNYVEKGKFYMQASCKESSAYELLSSELNEIEVEKNKYINDRIHKNRVNMLLYILFVIIIITFWILNNCYDTIPRWLSNIIGISLFVVSSFIMNLINHSFLKLVFNKKKAISKYGADFTEGLINHKKGKK